MQIDWAIEYITLWFFVLNSILTALFFSKGIQVEKYVNILPQRGWIQSVLNERDPDLKIWSAEDWLKSRKENSSTRLKIYCILMATFPMICIFLI